MILNDLTKFLNSYKDFIIKNTDMFSNNEEINKEQNSFNLLYDKNTADEKENSFNFFYDQEEPEEKINSLKTLTPSTKEEKQLSKEEFHNFLCQIMAFIEDNKYHSYTNLNNLCFEIIQKFSKYKYQKI